MYDSSWKSFVVLRQSRDLWEPRNIIVTRCHYQRIKPFSPPIIFSGAFLSQRQHPLVTLLNGPLNRSPELQEPLCPVLDKDVLDPPPNRLSMAEWGARPVLPKSSLRQLVRERLLGIAHDLRDNVAMQMFVLGRIRVAQLVAVHDLGLWGLGGQFGRDWYGVIRLPLEKLSQRGNLRGQVRSVYPAYYVSISIPEEDRLVKLTMFLR